MVLTPATVLTILSAMIQAIDCLSCPNQSTSNVPQEGLNIENGTLTFFNMLDSNEFKYSGFKYSLGRCLQAQVQYDKQELSINIDCLNSRVIKRAIQKIYATLTYVSHELTTESSGKRSFELYVCFNSPYRQGWIVVNQEPKFVDGPTIGWSRLTFRQECACNFRIEIKVFYTNPAAALRKHTKPAEPKTFWIATSVFVIALGILVLCVICSYF